MCVCVYLLHEKNSAYTHQWTLKSPFFFLPYHFSCICVASLKYNTVYVFRLIANHVDVCLQ